VTPELTHHGGRLSDARAHYGGAAGDWLDLSTGINPISWAAPTETQFDWQALPDPRRLAELEATAAAYFGVDARLCCAVPGSESGLRALAQLLQLPGRHGSLSYSTHADAFAEAAPMSNDDNGRAVRVLGNPNNPDGRAIAPPDVLAALEQQERHDGWLIVDEAFADCIPHLSVAPQVADDRRLIVTRSFGKFFGLAGVRLGFVIAPAPLLARLRHLQGEWPVCAAAIAFGTPAYGDSAWIAATRSHLTATAAQLDRVLQRHGLAPSGACPLFRLVETSSARRLFEALARSRILTRAFAQHSQFVRFGLPGSADALARLDAALANVRADG
jgi:cobalamin biosynthetic protein CobC